MRVICITQARMGSSRLPGKVLIPIQGKPMLEYHMNRVKLARLVDTHLVATTIKPIDRPIVDYCKAHEYECFCGDEQDVLSRFYYAAKHVGANSKDIIVRLTGDCPLISPDLIDETVTKHCQGQESQYTHVSLNYFPRGFDVEVFSMKSLTLAFNTADTSIQREHVTPYLYNKDKALIVPIETGKTAWSTFRLCVDEPTDLKLVEEIIVRLGKNWPKASPKDICSILINEPHLAQINARVIQRNTH